jgi:hypothetical protein
MILPLLAGYLLYVLTCSTVDADTIGGISAGGIMRNDVPGTAEGGGKSTSEDQAQLKLNSVIDKILHLHDMKYTGKGVDYSQASSGSSIHRICDSLVADGDQGVDDRVGCNAPEDTRHIYNAMISRKKITLFRDKQSTPSPLDASPLPGIQSLIRTIGYKAKTSITWKNLDGDKETFHNTGQCTQRFNGTLHVLGVQGPTNVYHVISDNYIPMISQILLDAYSMSPYLKKPRMAVIYKISAEYGGGANNKRPGLENKHFNLQKKLYTGGIHSWQKLDGMCFERIVWGWGPHTIFHYHMAKQRRMATDFARMHASFMYDLQIPASWQSPTRGAVASPQRHQAAQPVNKADESRLLLLNGLRIVLFTRGDSGKGRSLANENVIVDNLRKAGANAVKCCDFSSRDSLKNQLSHAYHADVILGMHGAALVHGVFAPKGVFVFELKTLYAFDSVLFALIADSREGTHVQVDFRSYFVPGGHKPADSVIADRCNEALIKAMQLTQRQNGGGGLSLDVSGSYQSPFVGQIYISNTLASSRAKLGIAISGSTKMTPALSHFLGPRREELQSECKQMTLHNLSVNLGASDGLRASQCPFAETYIPSSIRVIQTDEWVL